MGPSTPPIDALSRQRDALRAQLVSVGDMRPGSLVARYRKCGKPSCRCAGQGERGHGPSWSLTHAVEGKTHDQDPPGRGGAADPGADYRISSVSSPDP